MPRERQDFQLLQGLLCSVVKYLTFPGYRDGKHAVRGQLPDLIQKKGECQKKTPGLGLTARQVNLQLQRIKHALQAAERLRRPPRCLAAASRVTMRPSRRAHRHRRHRRRCLTLMQTAAKKKNAEVFFSCCFFNDSS